MIIYKKRGFVSRNRYGGAGIYDSLANFFARLLGSNVAKQIATSAVDVGKSVAKEGAKKALEAGKSAAVDAGKRLVEKVLTPKSKKILQKYDASRDAGINALIDGSGNDAIATQELVKRLNSGSGIKVL